jgi:hypothetical protein
MKGIYPSLFLTLALLLQACGARDREYPEQISKMRVLGVAADPVMATPGTLVRLTLHLALLKDESVEVVGVSDDQAAAAALAFAAQDVAVLKDATGMAGSVCEEGKERCAFASFDYKAVAATFTVPATPEMSAVLAVRKAVKVRYAFKVSAPSNTIALVGDTYVFAPGAGELTGMTPSVSIRQPAPSQVLPAGQKVKIAAAIDKYFDENHRVAWFVGGGKITNRRAAETEWETPAPGTYTLAFASHGAKSQSMALEIRDIKVE